VSWEIILVPEVHDWFMTLDEISASLVRDSVELLADRGPALGHPAVDRITSSQLHNLKELRPGSAGKTEIRILFIFDPQRRAVLLVAGDKAGNWTRWYRDAIKLAEDRYARYLATPPEEIRLPRATGGRPPWTSAAGPTQASMTRPAALRPATSATPAISATTWPRCASSAA